MNYVIKQIQADLEEGLDSQDIQYTYFGDPEELPDDVLIKGAITVNPATTDIDAITTGITDEYIFALELTVYKSLRGIPNNAQKETGAEFMTRIIEGRDQDGSLLTNSIVQILKKNQRSYGQMITSLGVVYDSEQSDVEGAVTATVNLGIMKHEQQLIN